MLNIDGYLGMGDSAASSNLDNSRTYQAVDNFSWIHGGHALKFGGDIRRLLGDATTNNWPFGQTTFTADLAGNSAAAFLLGFPRTTLTPEGVPISAIRQWRYAFYVQDDWKVTQNLTLNLGLRYDLFGQPHEINGVSRLLRFDLDPNGPGVVARPRPRKWTSGKKNDYRYFSPRFGLAWRLPMRTVFRGGYGIFYSAAPVRQHQHPAAQSAQRRQPDGDQSYAEPDRHHPEPGAVRTLSRQSHFQCGHPAARPAAAQRLPAKLERANRKGTHFERRVRYRLGG